MSGRLWITVFLLASLLVFSGGCSTRRKMIEQQQAQIARCEGEIADVTADEGWRKERDSFVESLSLEKQETDLRLSVCKSLRDTLKAKYSTLKNDISDDLLKAVSFDDMNQMYEAFREEPAITKWMISDDMKKKVEMELGTKSIQQIISELDAQYPMFRVADLPNGIDGERVTFTKVNGVRRTVSGRLNAVMDNGAKFDATFCPYDDMPDEIIIRIRMDARKRFFRMQAAEIQLEQNLRVSKRLREVLPRRFVECGYLLQPESIGNVMDLNSPDNWVSKPELLKQAYKGIFTTKMQENHYEFMELLPENGKEWVPEDVIDKLDELKGHKQNLQETLESLKNKK